MRVRVLMIDAEETVLRIARAGGQRKVAYKIVVVAELSLLSELALSMRFKFGCIADYLISPPNHDVRRITCRHSMAFADSGRDLTETKARLVLAASRAREPNHRS